MARLFVIAGKLVLRRLRVTPFYAKKSKFPGEFCEHRLMSKLSDLFHLKEHSSLKQRAHHLIAVGAVA